MSQDAPWYAKHVNVPNVCLIAGIIFMLCAVGQLEVGSIKINPSENISNTSRFIFMSIGVLLTLTGVALNLYTTSFWKPVFSLLYFSLTLILILAFGVVSLTSPPFPTEKRFRVIKTWNVTRAAFSAQIDTSQLQEFRKTHELLLICRKFKEAPQFENDIDIYKSEAYTILESDNTPITSMAVNFDQKLFNVLNNGDRIECALGLIPKDFSRDEIVKVTDIERHNGMLLGRVFDDLKPECRDQGGH